METIIDKINRFEVLEEPTVEAFNEIFTTFLPYSLDLTLEIGAPVSPETRRLIYLSNGVVDTYHFDQKELYYYKLAIAKKSRGASFYRVKNSVIDYLFPTLVQAADFLKTSPQIVRKRMDENQPFEGYHIEEVYNEVTSR